MAYSPDRFLFNVYERGFDYTTEHGCLEQIALLLTAFPIIGQESVFEGMLENGFSGNPAQHFSDLQGIALRGTQLLANDCTGSSQNTLNSQQGDGTLSGGGFGWGGFGISPNYDDFATDWARLGFDVQYALTTGSNSQVLQEYINYLVQQNAAASLAMRYNDFQEGIPVGTVFPSILAPRSGHDYGTAAPISGLMIAGSARLLTEGEKAVARASQDDPGTPVAEVVVFATRQTNVTFTLGNTIYVRADIAAVDFSVSPGGRALIAHEYNHFVEEKKTGAARYVITRQLGGKIQRVYEWDIDLANPRLPFSKLGIEQRASVVESYQRALENMPPVEYTGSNQGAITATSLRQYIFGH